MLSPVDFLCETRIFEKLKMNLNVAKKLLAGNFYLPHNWFKRDVLDITKLINTYFHGCSM